MHRNVSFTHRFAASIANQQSASVDHDDKYEKKKKVNTMSTPITISIGVLFKVIDVGLVVFAGWLTWKALAGHVIKPVEHGFDCAHIAQLDKPLVDHTVSVPVLLYTVLLAPYFVFELFEAFYLVTKTNIAFRLRLYFANTTRYCTRYLIGFTFQIILMEAGKCWIGRLRPNFVSMCRPDWDMIGVDCMDPANGHVFVHDTHCQADQWWQRTARTSFPSGHSSCAVYMFTCVSLYLFELWQCEKLNQTPHASSASSTRLRYVCTWTVVVVAGVFAAVTCISRVTDGWHHVTDVFGGISLGIVCALVLFPVTVDRVHSAHKLRAGISD